MSNQRKRLNTHDTAERRAQMLHMRRQRRPWQEIADTLGYASPGAACTDYKRCLDQRTKEANFTADQHIHEEFEHLEELTAQAIKLLERDYEKWAGEDAGSVFDPAPKLQAIESLRRLSESRRKLLGLDAPTRVEADGQLQVTIGVTQTELDNLT